LRKISLLVLVFIVGACSVSSPNTKNVNFNYAEIQTIPLEIAIDRVTSFSKATSRDKYSNCVFTAVGVGNKRGNSIIPYSQLYFNAENKTDNIIEADNPHLFIYRKNDGKLVCDSRIGTGEYAGAQREFDSRIQWVGSSLIALKAEYRE